MYRLALYKPSLPYAATPMIVGGVSASGIVQMVPLSYDPFDVLFHWTERKRTPPHLQK